ncbi:hypothetical protein AAEZ42_09575 [Limosilactobacillus fermentum]
MVIMGFADTLHQARYVAEENTFQEEQVDQMVAKLKKVTEDPQELEKPCRPSGSMPTGYCRRITKNYLDKIR